MMMDIPYYNMKKAVLDKKRQEIKDLRKEIVQSAQGTDAEEQVITTVTRLNKAYSELEDLYNLFQ